MKQGIAFGMLQPLQLNDVLSRYPAEIAQVRDFLTKAGIRMGTVNALADVATRLTDDRAFHRDLTSYLWVVLDNDPAMGQADLLGVLAIAAAGPRLASNAEEDVAHHLLRFIMGAKRSLGSTAPLPPARPLPPQTPPPAPLPAPPPVERIREPELQPQPKRPAAQPAPILRAITPSWAPPLENVDETSEAVIAEPQRWNFRWLAIACVLALLAGGLWFFLRRPAAVTHDEAAATPAPIVTPRVAAPAPVAPAPVTVEEPVRQAEPVQPVIVARHPSVTRSQPRTAPARVPAPEPQRLQTPPLRAAAEPAPAPFTAAALPAHAPAPAGLGAGAPAPIVRSAAPAASTPLIARTTAAPKTAQPISADTLSQRLGARTLPTYAAGQGGPDAYDPKYPRLLRRSPANSATYGTDAGLLAENQPIANPASRGTAASAGTVHSTSMGIMAAYILYSPLPGYPQAAAASHVQGDVKVQAEVGRDGTVASAHVISGPPLLRDAALEAVQHWRYKPYTQAGKAIPMSATAVVQFDLP